MYTRQKLHPCRLAVFALLGVADLGLTWKLIHSGHGHVYESNPVAGAWLECYGWTGLAVFKTLAMLLVGLSAVYVSWHRPRTGRRLLTFGCLVTAGVVIYSCFLLGFLGGPASASLEDDVRRTEQFGRELDRDLQHERAYFSLVQRLGHDLRAGRSSLADAVQELARSEKGRDPHWLDRLHACYPNRSDTECLALHLTFRAVKQAQEGGVPWQLLAEQLQTDFETNYGRPPRSVFAEVSGGQMEQKSNPERKRRASGGSARVFSPPCRRATPSGPAKRARPGRVYATSLIVPAG